MEHGKRHLAVPAPVSLTAAARVSGRRVSHAGAVATRPAGTECVDANFSQRALFGYMAWGASARRRHSSVMLRQETLGKLSDKKRALHSTELWDLSWQCKNNTLKSYTSYIRFKDMLFEGYSVDCNWRGGKKNSKRNWEAKIGFAVVVPLYICTKYPLNIIHPYPLLLSLVCILRHCSNHRIWMSKSPLAVSFKITAGKFSRPAEFKGAAEALTVTAVIHYSLTFTRY